MPDDPKIYLDTPVSALIEQGLMDRTVSRACESAKPPMQTAGDILMHLQNHGDFSDVPGCRRPGRIPDTLHGIALMVEKSNTPSEEKPTIRKRVLAKELDNEAAFDFLTERQRNDTLEFRRQYGHLPMFKVLNFYLTRPSAERNDTIMACALGFDRKGNEQYSLADIGQEVNLSRERIRQIVQTYSLPDQLMHPSLWKQYADHSTYYSDSTSRAYQMATLEVPDMTFASYAMILHRTTMLQNVEDRYLARRGWADEIAAWVKKLSQLARVSRSIDSRISLEGLAMGGSLDIRISLVVINQIAPALGLIPDGRDSIILPKNR